MRGLSELQKKILTLAYSRYDANECINAGDVLNEFYSAKTNAARAAVSKALRRLCERELLYSWTIEHSAAWVQLVGIRYYQGMREGYALTDSKGIEYVTANNLQNYTVISHCTNGGDA